LSILVIVILLLGRLVVIHWLYFICLSRDAIATHIHCQGPVGDSRQTLSFEWRTKIDHDVGIFSDTRRWKGLAHVGFESLNGATNAMANAAEIVVSGSSLSPCIDHGQIKGSFRNSPAPAVGGGTLFVDPFLLAIRDKLFLLAQPMAQPSVVWNGAN
jgi:hypothetical protein